MLLAASEPVLAWVPAPLLLLLLHVRLCASGSADSLSAAAGWSSAGSAGAAAAGKEANIPCTLERLDHLDAATFAAHYAGRRPFILSAGGVDGTLKRHAARWDRSAFLDEFGDADVPVGKPISREAVRTQRMVRLRDYADGLLSASDGSSDGASCREEEEGSLYLFDRGEFFERNPSVAW